MPRGVSSSIITELDKAEFEAPIYALRIVRESGTLYWAERAVTIDGQLYEARLKSVDGVEFTPGVAAQFTIVALNVDGAITLLDRIESFAGCRCEILEYLPTLNLYSARSVAYLDEITELSPETATIPGYGEHTASSLVGVPKRSVSASCPHHFGNFANYVTALNFEGSECPYQRVSTIGFTASLQDTLDAVSSPVTFVVNWSAGIDAAGAKFKATDQITIGTEKMLVTAADTVDGLGDQEVTVSRGYGGSTMATHAISDGVKFSNCQFSDAACIRRGMYGNNSFDTFSGFSRNYFGGFPIISGTQWGFFRTKQGEKPSPQRVNFSGNESAYGLALSLPYGKVRISDPVLILAVGEGDFLTTYWAVCEGLLATNATDDSQTTRINAYTGGAANTQIFVNGVSRHDSRPGFGIEQWNGQMDQPPPSAIWFPGSYPEDFDAFSLGFNATAWCVFRINTKNNPGVDVTGQQIGGAFTVEYGRVVRTYTNPSTFTRKATTNPAWVAFDIRTAKRVGAGVDYARMNIQSYIDTATYNDGLVTTTDEEATGMIKRWTFNGILDQKRPFSEWERLVCLGMYALPPFIGADGKYKIKSLKAETLSGLPVLSSLVATSARNILWEPGEGGIERTSLVKVRKSILDVPNQISVTFMDKATFTKVSMTVADRDAQEDLGHKLGDQSRRLIEKAYSLPGTSTIEEAARWATLVLRCGEFAEGGLANNNGVRFKMFYRGAVNLELGDVVELHDEQLDAAEGERYYRITRLGDQSSYLNDGGFLYVREVEAWVHDNALYDDGAFTVTHFERLAGTAPNDQEPPAVTGLSISESGALDANGTPVSLLTINYTEPIPLENFRSLTIWSSTDDGAGSPQGDWFFIGEVLASGAILSVSITGLLTHFAAVSKGVSAHVADVDTRDSTGAFKYPRVAIIVDGFTDTDVASAPIVGVVKSQGQWGDARFEMTIGVDIPVTPSFWNTVYRTEIHITTDPTFATFPAGESLHSLYNWTPPNSIEFATNTVGTYYVRARVYNIQGPGAWSATVVRSTNMLDSGADTDLIAAPTPSITNIAGTEFDVDFFIPTGQTSTFYGYSVYGHSSATLPTATKAAIGSAGSVTAGISKLTDLTATWTVDQWATNYDIVLFDTHRGVTPTFDYEGMFIVCQILSNTATVITFNAPSSQVRRTMTGMTYFIVARGAGHHFWEKLTFTTPVIVDEAITAAEPSDVPGTSDRRFHMIASVPNLYIWITLYNALGQGEITGTPAHWTYGGTPSGEMEFLDITDGRDIGNIAVGRSLLASTETGFVHIQPNAADGFAQYADTTTGGFTSMDPGHLNVRDYGAKGDGTTDDTAAIQRAIAAAQAEGCGVVFFPAGHWKFSTLTVTDTVTLKGVGWKTIVNAPKGDSQWTTLSNHTGSVLFSTSTSGIALNLVGTSTFPVHLKDFMLVGSGSTVTGIALGSASFSCVQCAWHNILVANCNRGYVFQNINDCSFYDCRSRGNSTGFEIAQDSNQNVYTNTEVHVATVRGIYLHDCGNNLFKGVLIQACTDGSGIYIDGAGSVINCFEDLWCENANSGFDYLINVQAGEKSIFKRVRMGGYGGIIVGVDAVNTIFEAVRNLANQPIVNAGNSTCFIKAGGGDTGHFTDTGMDTFYIQDPNVSNSNKLKCPELEVTGDADIGGNFTVDTINGQTINTPGSANIEKLSLTSSNTEQSVFTEYTNTADSLTAFVGLGPDAAGDVHVRPDDDTRCLFVNGGITVGSGLIGNSPGNGFVNVESGLQLNGGAYDYPDYALEHYYTGAIVKHADKPGANTYPGLLSLKTVEDHMKTNYQLPRIAERGGNEIFARSDALLEKIEELFLYLIEIDKRLQSLERGWK